MNVQEKSGGQSLGTAADAVSRAVEALGPREAFARLMAENDTRIHGSDLENGRALVTERSAIYLGLVAHWAATEHRVFGYDRPFAVAALGGTGRAEITPYSDNEFALLFVDPIEGNPFRERLQRQVLHTPEFFERYGFECQVQPYTLDDMPRLTDKQLNSFLDLRPVYDPGGIAGRFRERIQSTVDAFEHFLHVRHFWRDQWEKAAAASERLDRFDIKNEGLRVFLAGIWTLAGRHFVHSEEIYRQLDDPRDLRAYELLLRIRTFVHTRKVPARPLSDGSHPQDILGFDDFLALGDLVGEAATERERFEFGNEVRARLLGARRRVAAFTKGVIERELKNGRPAAPGSPVVFGVGGLYSAGPPRPEATPVERSRVALQLLLAAQRHRVPIDPSELESTFRNAGDWLCRVPELSALFYELRGSLADSLDFLAQFEGAMGRLFPGYDRFEASLDGRVLTEKRSLRGALERQKIRALERYVSEGRHSLTQAGVEGAAGSGDLSREGAVPAQAALLDADHLAAVKLALHTKRLPLTPDDSRVRADETRSLPERFSTGMSEIPLADYFGPFQAEADFTPETVRITQWLLEHRRAFKDRFEAGPNDTRQVAEFASMCQDEQRLRALFVFTCADRAEWESEEQEPARWFSARELYGKVLARFRPGHDPELSLARAGYSPEQLAILRDFGADFFGGVYRQYANKFGSHLVRLAEGREEVGPRASLLRSGASVILGVAARDYRGLAASITGALLRSGINLVQAHLFSAMNHGLALDFFHVAPSSAAPGPTVARAVEEAIRERRYIADTDETGLPDVGGKVTLEEWRPGQYCLRLDAAQETPGVIYALAYRVFRRLHGNIFGLAAHSSRGRTFVSIYHSLPPELTLETARQALAERPWRSS